MGRCFAVPRQCQVPVARVAQMKGSSAKYTAKIFLGPPNTCLASSLQPRKSFCHSLGQNTHTHTNTQHNTKLSCSSNKQYTKYNPKGLCTLVNCTHFYAKKNKSQDKGRAVHESLVGGGQTSPCAPLGGGPAPTHHGSSQGKFIMSRKKILCKKSPEMLEGVVGEGVVGPHPQ